MERSTALVLSTSILAMYFGIKTGIYAEQIHQEMTNKKLRVERDYLRVSSQAGEELYNNLVGQTDPSVALKRYQEQMDFFRIIAMR